MELLTIDSKFLYLLLEFTFFVRMCLIINVIMVRSPT